MPPTPAGNRLVRLTIVTLMVCGLSSTAAERPNFVWILSEDNSTHHLRLFDEHGPPTPQIETLARDGLIFDHAFSNSPVCSVARTTLITSIYAPRAGTQFHRKIRIASLPDGWRMFPAFLRQAGYYTTNCVKKDYNAVEGPGVWDASSRQASWRNRPTPETSFFHMHTLHHSHEGSLHFSADQMEREETANDPDQIALAPYHPDTDTFRYTYARFHDRIQAMDRDVGALIADLAEDGLLEDTFIFYFGDHGGVLPRSKGYLYESGLHVPLVVRVPENWQHLAPLPRGSRVSGFVSFVDFGPTLLHLAGLGVPEYMDGSPFLGRDVNAETLNARQEAFGYADRFDEKYDLSRSLRSGRYKYLRHYQPFYPDALQNNYRYRMLAFQEWRQLFRQGALDPVQRQFFEAKPREALYDLETDPHETINLATDPRYRDVLLSLRGRLRELVQGLPDLSFFPESHLVAQAMDDPVAFGQRHGERLAELVAVADLSLVEFAAARTALVAALESEDRWQRYWALIAGSSFGPQAAPLIPAARARLDDPELLVRMRAAQFLAIVADQDPRPVLYQVLNETRSPVVALLTLNTAVAFHDRWPDPLPFDLEQVHLQIKSSEVDRRLDYLARP